ncbi:MULTISPECIES: gliding motility lipoprotein GldD [Flavobacterium]|uniref:gliding motility lipoprotein GldD n=1 Tax=Flavobacterium TaxID=237 RepID=UPI00391B77B2
MINKVIGFLTVLLLLAFTGCKNEVLPKPAGQLRLDYEVAKYTSFNSSCPFTFEMNEKAKVNATQNCEFTINYPKMKATIYLTYKTVNNDIDKLLRDAQKLTYEHVIKADDILEQPYINNDKKVYGMFYRVSGNAATNAQFYATDSIKHFVTGSVYFYAKPNFDSIMPAADYIRNDMQHLIESIQWTQGR